MPKYTYPIVFILNEETGNYNGYIPDLAIFAEGEKLESVYAEAEEIIHNYFRLAAKHNVEIPGPTSLEDIAKKWKGFKISLITANIT